MSKLPFTIAPGARFTHRAHWIKEQEPHAPKKREWSFWQAAQLIFWAAVIGAIVGYFAM